MSVKLTNFVKINIKHHLSTPVNATRGIAALFHNNSTLATIKYMDLKTEPNDYTAVDYAHLSGIKDYIHAFFANGGKELYVISGALDADVIVAELNKLPMEYIMVGLVNDTAGTQLAESVFRAAANVWNVSKADEKIFQKIFVAEIPYSAGVSDLDAYVNDGKKVVEQENYVLKYGAQGIGASVLAYFTKINVYAYNATQDYAFTTEAYDTADASHFVFTDNAIIEKIIALDLNADTKLAGSVKNVGGNDTAGYDLTNQFMLLVLHQTLTERIIQVLTNKIKYNSTGVALVLNAIIAELNRFVSNGYLATNKVWTEPDLYYEGYKVIDSNSVLNNGYKVMILPFASLTEAEQNAHQLPKIYILLADSYSIRKIVIDGEVF